MSEAQKLLESHQNNWNPFATKNEEALREAKSHPDIRPDFSRDGDKILHSWSFTRYLGKSQVFFTSSFDMMSSRIIHVQLVSKIARHIGRILGFNQDLIEAIALGHDIGHAPYGHVGEQILSEITSPLGIGYYWHNVQSIRWLHDIESHNLTLQTLDGILCHNGESRSFEITMAPKKSFHNMRDEIAKIQSSSSKEILNQIRPMTPEGCIVRICDFIAYIGRDIEDAIVMNLIRRDDLPQDIVAVLGASNRQIVNTLVNDLIQTFINDYPDIIAVGLGKERNVSSKDLLRFRFSTEIRQVASKLLTFNYNQIYQKSSFREQKETIEPRMKVLFNHYLDDFNRKKMTSEIFFDHIQFTEQYLASRKKLTKYGTGEPPELIVRDFVAGMTERYFEGLFTKIS